MALSSGRDPRLFQFSLDPARRPKTAAIREFWPKEIRPYAEAASGSRPGPARESVRVFVVHATAGGSSEGALSVVRARRASFHWLVPGEREKAHGEGIMAVVAESRAAWHVRSNCSHPDVLKGARRLNDYSLGLEIVNQQDGKDPFSDWQIEATACAIRYAWAKYPRLEAVVSHARLDPERRSDPGRLFPWERLETLTLAAESGE